MKRWRLTLGLVVISLAIAADTAAGQSTAPLDIADFRRRYRPRKWLGPLPSA